jgi:multicomponent K+:H+ antiporter subunit A
MPLVVLLLLPFFGSVLTALLPTRARTALAGCAGLVSAVAALWVIACFRGCGKGRL